MLEIGMGRFGTSETLLDLESLLCNHFVTTSKLLQFRRPCNHFVTTSINGPEGRISLLGHPLFENEKKRDT